MLGYDPPENQSLETIGGQGRRGGRVMDEGESDNEEGVCVCTVCEHCMHALCVYVCVSIVCMHCVCVCVCT